MTDRVTEKTVVDGSPDEIRAVLVDFERYPSWAKNLKSVDVLSTDGNGEGDQVRFRAAGMGRSTSYTLRYDLSDPHVVAWALVEGDITTKLDGRYGLTPVDGGTEVTYELEVELKVPLPSFVKNRTQGRIMHTALHELKARVEGSE